MSRLHIAVLDEELPYPLTSGKRIRTFNLLSRLATAQRITYVAHRNPDAAEQAAARTALRDLGITPLVVDYEIPPKSGLGFYGRLAGNLFSTLPFSVATHASRAMQAAIERLSREDKPALWHCEWTPYAHMLRGRLIPWVVMAHNVESLIWQRYAESASNPALRWFLTKQWRRFEAFERWVYANATRAVAVSSADAELMTTHFGAANVAVVENGVDTAYFQPAEGVTRAAQRLLFLGSLDWRPNLDAVKLLLTEIWPKVQAQVPDARLVIVGRKPPAALRQRVARQAGVELHADVPDVRPFLASAGMLVVPLRIGGGSRLKILEALAAGTPVVTTTIGAEGLRLTPGAHCIVADGAEVFAGAVVQAIRNAGAARETARQGRGQVLAEYDWIGLAARMGEVWRAVADRAKHGRQ